MRYIFIRQNIISFVEKYSSQKKFWFIKFSFDKKYFYSIKKSSFDNKKNNIFFRENHMVSLGLIAKLESLRDAATIESTSQRLSSQVVR